MRSSFLCLALCATYVLAASIERNQNTNIRVVKTSERISKRAILYNAHPMGSNRNTDDDLELPPAQAYTPGNSTEAIDGQSGAFGDRKKKDMKNSGNKGDKKDDEEDNDDGDNEDEEDDADSKKNNNEKDGKDGKDKDEDDEDNDEKADKNGDDDDNKDKENEEAGEDNAQDNVDLTHTGVNFEATASASQYIQSQGSLYASASSAGHSELDFTFGPATLAAEKTAPGGESLPTELNQNVEKIEESQEQSGASHITRTGGTMMALSVVLGYAFFSL